VFCAVVLCVHVYCVGIARVVLAGAGGGERPRSSLIACTCDVRGVVLWERNAADLNRPRPYLCVSELNLNILL